jgi:hypothetical protein
LAAKKEEEYLGVKRDTPIGCKADHRAQRDLE